MQTLNRFVAAIALSAYVVVIGAARAQTADAVTKTSDFDRIKALSGDWTVTEAPGEHGTHGGTVTYKVTAAGSAVLETLFAGTDHEMVTLYYMDGKDLAMTHYCMLHNRPQMRAAVADTPNKIVFKCEDGDKNKIEAEDHMHQASFTFTDGDHLKTEWVLYKGGKADSTHTFQLERKKK